MNMLKKKLDKMNRSQLRYICMRVFEQIDFTKLKTEKDMVNFLLKPLENKYKMISRYKQKPLQQFTERIKNDSDEIEYTFTEEGDKKYKIFVYENNLGTTVHARLDTDMTKNIDIVQLEYIKGEKLIKINLVSLETGGVCTRSVAYTMKALLNYIEHPRLIYGNVHIKSKNAAKAFNCYNRAFQLNGFALDEGEFERFKKAYLVQTAGNSNTEVDFTFSNFTKIGK